MAGGVEPRAACTRSQRQVLSACINPISTDCTRVAACFVTHSTPRQPATPLKSCLWIITLRIISLGMLFTCPECDRRCKSLSGLRRHQNSTHRNDPGLNIPVTELRRIYHPNLNGMYNALRITLSKYPQASAAIGMEQLFLRTCHQKPQLSRQTVIGHLSYPELVSSSPNLSTPMPNYHREKSTSFSNCGLQRSFPTVTVHPSPTTEISTSRSTQSTSATSRGRTHA
jgi:hypothetical protein